MKEVCGWRHGHTHIDANTPPYQAQAGKGSHSWRCLHDQAKAKREREYPSWFRFRTQISRKPCSAHPCNCWATGMLGTLKCSRLLFFFLKLVSKNNIPHFPTCQTLLHPSPGVLSHSVEKSLPPSFWAGFWAFSGLFQYKYHNSYSTGQGWNSSNKQPQKKGGWGCGEAGRLVFYQTDAEACAFQLIQSLLL